MSVKKVFRGLLWFSVLGIAVGAGFFACFFTNGYPRSVIGLDRSDSDMGRRAWARLTEGRKALTGQSVHVGEILGYTPKQVCLQGPYLPSVVFRGDLNANVIGYRTLDDQEPGLLWLIDQSVFVGFVSVPRVLLMDRMQPLVAVRCVAGKQAVIGFR